MISNTLISILCLVVAVVAFSVIILCNKVKIWAKNKVKERNKSKISAHRYYANKVQELN
jgi:hypothetical protein